MWFAYGDLVIDRILGVSRVKGISVYYSELTCKPSKAELAEALAISLETPIYFTNVIPPIVFDYQRYALVGEHDFIDRLSNSPCDRPAPPPSANLLTYELSAADILGLWATRQRYVELYVPDGFLRRIIADVRHLAAIRDSFPELALIFEANDL
jgi:hypothetical protein